MSLSEAFLGPYFCTGTCNKYICLDMQVKTGCLFYTKLWFQPSVFFCLLTAKICQRGALPLLSCSQRVHCNFGTPDKTGRELCNTYLLCALLIIKIKFSSSCLQQLGKGTQEARRPFVNNIVKLNTKFYMAFHESILLGLLKDQ